MAFQVSSIQTGCCRSDEQRSAGWHRVASVEGQIDDHLFHHPLICFDRGEIVRVIAVKFDLITERVLQTNTLIIAGQLVRGQEILGTVRAGCAPGECCVKGLYSAYAICDRQPNL